MIALFVLAGLLLLLGLAALYQRRRFPSDEAPLVDAIDGLLPQTQCAQCGFPGCRPYAEALAHGDATIDLCPPGGADVHAALEVLLKPEVSTFAPSTTHTQRALIDETQCIGCTLCLPPCPVDAIIGGQGKMHTVIELQCTGCELCVPACPVDCIVMVDIQTPTEPSPTKVSADLGCIKCGACDPVCPVDLPVAAMWAAAEEGSSKDAASLGLARCIECGLCDTVCPSGIPLAHAFGQHKEAVDALEREQRNREALKARFTAHEERFAARAESSADKRRERLERSRKWS